MTNPSKTRAPKRPRHLRDANRVTTNGIDTNNPWIRAAMANQVMAQMKAEAQDRARIETEFQSQLTETRLKLYMIEHGQDATELLAILMVVIGTPCEAGAQSPNIGRAEPWVRQLHGALRTLHTMCLSGYRWDSAHANAIDRAIEIANTERAGIPIETYAKAWVEANGLATIVLAHQVNAESIA